jgi:hypothetical protein
MTIFQAPTPDQPTTQPTMTKTITQIAIGTTPSEARAPCRDQRPRQPVPTRPRPGAADRAAPDQKTLAVEETRDHVTGEDRRDDDLDSDDHDRCQYPLSGERADAQSGGEENDDDKFEPQADLHHLVDRRLTRLGLIGGAEPVSEAMVAWMPSVPGSPFRKAVVACGCCSIQLCSRVWSTWSGTQMLLTVPARSGLDASSGTEVRRCGTTSKRMQPSGLSFRRQSWWASGTYILEALIAMPR